MEIKYLYRYIMLSCFIAFFISNSAIASEKISIPILMYHHIIENSDKINSATITLDKFQTDMTYLKNRGYNTISFKDLINYKNGYGELPEKPIIITFDDGYYSIYKYAYPILNENKMKASMFIIGHTVGKNDLDGKSIIPHFSWEEAKEMYDSGLIEIQPHTFNLHNPAETDKYGIGVLPKVYENEIQYSLRIYLDSEKLKKLIEQKIGCEVYAFSYPYGKYNHTVERLLKSLNIKVTLTTNEGYSDVSNYLYLLNRINVDEKTELSQIIR